jgi:hypothetical protein
VYELHPELDIMGSAESDWQALHNALKEAWHAIPDLLVKKLISSMPRRLEAVRKAKGWQTNIKLCLISGGSKTGGVAINTI